MSPAQALLEHYEELERLSQGVLRSLGQGVDLTALGPVFERKAVLGGLIKALKVQGADLGDRALTSRLLEAQDRATKTEAALVQVLQPIVSSIGINRHKFGSKAGGESGTRIDQTG